MNNELFTIASLFSNHTIISVEPFGNGNINDTYLTTSTHEKFILQRLNSTVFPNPKQIFENQEKLQAIINDTTDNQYKVHIPTIRVNHNGVNHIQDKKRQYWRAQEFIINGEEIEMLHIHAGQSVGKLLGSFHGLCTNPTSLEFHNTLPDLHDTQAHLKQYHTQNAPTPKNTNKDDLQLCREHLNQYQNEAITLDSNLHHPKLNKRLIHGDPKLANILFDKTSHKACSLIDLDTIGVGPIHHDLSDLIRSCCNTNGEERATSKEVFFNLTLAKEIITGYCHATASVLDTSEINLLGSALWILPYELAVRFLNDYLAGSIYFKTSYPEQNLHRACIQFKLTKLIHQNQRTLQSHVNHCMVVTDQHL